MVMTHSARYPIALVCCLFLHHGIVRGDQAHQPRSVSPSRSLQGWDQTGPSLAGCWWCWDERTVASPGWLSVRLDGYLRAGDDAANVESLASGRGHALSKAASRLSRSTVAPSLRREHLPLPTPELSIHQFNRRVPGFQGLQLVRLLRPLERCQEGQDGVRVDGLDQMVVEARLA